MARMAAGHGRPGPRRDNAKSWQGWLRCEVVVGGIDASEILLDLQVLQVSEPEGRTQTFPQFEPVLFGDGHEDIDDLGIKLAARTALNLLARMGHGQSSAIGPIADH